MERDLGRNLITVSKGAFRVGAALLVADLAVAACSSPAQQAAITPTRIPVVTPEPTGIVKPTFEAYTPTPAQIKQPTKTPEATPTLPPTETPKPADTATATATATATEVVKKESSLKRYVPYVGNLVNEKNGAVEGKILVASIPGATMDIEQGVFVCYIYHPNGAQGISYRAFMATIDEVQQDGTFHGAGNFGFSIQGKTDNGGESFIGITYTIVKGKPTGIYSTEASAETGLGRESIETKIGDIVDDVTEVKGNPVTPSIMADFQKTVDFDEWPENPQGTK